VHASDGVVAVGRDGKSSGGSVSRRRRGSASVSVEAVISAVYVNTGSSVAGVVVDGVLHLAQEVVDMDEILLGACVGHGQVVLLSHGVVAGCGSVKNGSRASRLGHILSGWPHGTVGNRQGAVERQQRATNIGIRRRIDLAALGMSEEVINHLVGAFAIIATGSSVVSEVLRSRGVQGRLVEVETIVGRWLRCIVTAMPSLVRERGRVSPHLTIVIVVTRRSWRRISLEVRRMGRVGPR
jgi:hypothetical protein